MAINFSFFKNCQFMRFNQYLNITFEIIKQFFFCFIKRKDFIFLFLVFCVYIIYSDICIIIDLI